MKKPRNPREISSDLSAHVADAERQFVPPRTNVVISLAAEFVAAVTERLEAAGLLADADPQPNPDPKPDPNPQPDPQALAL